MTLNQIRIEARGDMEYVDREQLMPEYIDWDEDAWTLTDQSIDAGGYRRYEHKSEHIVLEITQAEPQVIMPE